MRSKPVWSLALCFILGLANAGAAVAGDAAAELLRHKVLSLSPEITRPADRDAMAAFYADRDYRPVWFQEGWLAPRAVAVIKQLRAAGDWGLDDANFALPALAETRESEPYSPETASGIEFEISAAVLRYAFQARGGRIAAPDKILSDFIDRQPVLPEPLAVLRTVSASANAAADLISFHPQHPQFAALRAAYVKLRAGQGTPHPTLGAEGDLLKPGMRHADVATLRQSLAVPSAAGEEDLYDTSLRDAVKLFQKEHKLSADGIVGRQTRKALQIGTGSEMRAILANMEEWRWMPDDLGAKYLFVNVPSYSLRLFEAGTVKLEERVIAGKPATPTPVFSGALSTIVLKPMWFMPDSIKREKLLAAHDRGGSVEDEGYVVKKGNRIVRSSDIDWSQAELKQYTFYQPAGDQNALGDVKFLFPNKYSVYLHDTPSRSLFAAEQRAFSHGCVRLRNPLALAQNLLDSDKGEAQADMKKLLKTAATSTDYPLSKPVPIHIAYFTRWVEADGAVGAFDDIYGHAERIAMALKRQPEDRTSPAAPAPEKAVVASLQTLSALKRPNEGVSTPRVKRPGAFGLGGEPAGRTRTAAWGDQPSDNRHGSRHTPGELMNAAWRH